MYNTTYRTEQISHRIQYDNKAAKIFNAEISTLKLWQTGGFTAQRTSFADPMKVDTASGRPRDDVCAYVSVSVSVSGHCMSGIVCSI